MFPRMGPRHILAAGWCLAIVFAYPGFVSPDSLVQLHQAREFEFNDQHPAMMGVVWRVLDTFFSGPLPMLLVQTGLFLVGVYGLLRRGGVSERAAAIAASCILVFPPVLTVMAVIWKDSQMAGYLMCGVMLVLSPSRIARVVGLVVLMIGAGMRHNAFAAMFPLVFFCFEWKAGWGWLRRHALATGVFVVVAGSAFACNRALTDHTVYFFHNSLAPFDISGVLSQSRNLPEAELADSLAGVPILVEGHPQDIARRYYNPTNYWQLNHDGMFHLIYEPKGAAAMFRAWKKLVTAHPYRYLQHRRKLWHVFLTDPMGPVWMEHVAFDGQSGYVHHDAQLSPVQAQLKRALKAQQDSMLFRPYIYLMIGLLLVPLAWRHRELLALLASGILYELSFFFLAATTDYRYSHWMISCVVVTAVALFLRRLAGAPSPERA